MNIFQSCLGFVLILHYSLWIATLHKKTELKMFRFVQIFSLNSLLNNYLVPLIVYFSIHGYKDLAYMLAKNRF